MAVVAAPAADVSTTVTNVTMPATLANQARPFTTRDQLIVFVECDAKLFVVAAAARFIAENG